MPKKLKAILRSFLVPLIYRYPPIGLGAERLYLYFHYLIACKDVPGDIVEIGCNLGGTAAMARNLTKSFAIDKRYLCFDTFDGFIEQQFSKDVELGTPAGARHMFSGNSRNLVAKILKRHHAEDVTLIEGDIATIPDSKLPQSCSVVLLDVDLAEPVYQALRRFWPRLSPGGVILVDDCPEGSQWKARVGYSRFCQENRLDEQYNLSMGIVSKPLHSNS